MGLAPSCVGESRWAERQLRGLVQMGGGAVFGEALQRHRHAQGLTQRAADADKQPNNSGLPEYTSQIATATGPTKYSNADKPKTSTLRTAM